MGMIHKFVDYMYWDGDEPLYEVGIGNDPECLENWLDKYGDDECEVVFCTYYNHHEYPATGLPGAYWFTRNGVWVEQADRAKTTFAKILRSELEAYNKKAKS